MERVMLIIAFSLLSAVVLTWIVMVVWVNIEIYKSMKWLKDRGALGMWGGPL